jgi:hypothetical protein
MSLANIDVELQRLELDVAEGCSGVCEIAHAIHGYVMCVLQG